MKAVGYQNSLPIEDAQALFDFEAAKPEPKGRDIRVAVAEDYLLEHALHALGIPSSLLIFPEEGHDLGQNPWHGKIKVREEAEWIEKYCACPAK